ncbi:MAG: hypothetical protein V1777_04355 [Candidatus Micrarchaeota archaeon]
MGKCILCDGQTNWAGVCASCDLNNNLTKRKGDFYEFVFSDRSNKIPVEDNLSIGEFIHKKGREKILELINETAMEESGYYKGEMCPFTQVEVGGTRAATLAFTGASLNEFVWTHSKCMQEYCAIWDNENKQCSIKTIAQRFMSKEK